MIHPEVIDALLSAGCTCEQLAAAVKADMLTEKRIRDENILARRAAGRERQRRYVKNQQNQRTPDANDASSQSSPLPPCPPSDKESPPTPLKEINSPLNPPTPFLHICAKVNFAHEFEAIWKIYPNKQSKKKSLLAYQKARKKLGNEEIKNSILRYIENKPQSQDWLHLVTWLNQERWNDDYSNTITFPAKPLKLQKPRAHEGTDEIFRRINAQLEQRAGTQDAAAYSRPLAASNAKALPGYREPDGGNDQGDGHDLYSISGKHIEGHR